MQVVGHEVEPDDSFNQNLWQEEEFTFCPRYLPVNMILHGLDVKVLKVPVAGWQGDGKSLGSQTLLQFLHQQYKIGGICLYTSTIGCAGIFLMMGLLSDPFWNTTTLSQQKLH